MPTVRRLSWPPLTVLLLAAGLPAWAQGGVTVNLAEVVVQRKTFDPRDPPPEMPPLGPRADAITESKFGCMAAVDYTVVSRRPEGQGRGRRGTAGGGGAAAGGGGSSGECTASARIESLHVTLELTVTIWLPRRCPPKLAAHEDGHRVIYERIYHDHAEAAARAAARRLVGRTLTATAPDCKAAVESAIREANQAFCDAYLESTAGWSKRVSQRYDALTSHGRRSEPGVDEAIRRSFEDEPEERAPRESRPQAGGRERQ